MQVASSCFKTLTASTSPQLPCDYTLPRRGLSIFKHVIFIQGACNRGARAGTRSSTHPLFRCLLTFHSILLRVTTFSIALGSQIVTLELHPITANALLVS
jgi:hypothetical protein